MYREIYDINWKTSVGVNVIFCVAVRGVQKI